MTSVYLNCWEYEIDIYVFDQDLCYKRKRDRFPEKYQLNKTSRKRLTITAIHCFTCDPSVNDSLFTCHRPESHVHGRTHMELALCMIIHSYIEENERGEWMYCRFAGTHICWVHPTCRYPIKFLSWFPVFSTFTFRNIVLFIIKYILIILLLVVFSLFWFAIFFQETSTC